MGTRRSVAAVVVVCGACSVTSASMSSFSVGSDLAGGTVTVTWFTGPGGDLLGQSSAVITAPVAGTGQAIVSDPFGGSGTAVLTVVGDTFLEQWTLENNADAIIGEVVIDLAGSLSAFDDGSASDTPGSALGVAGVEYTAGLSTAPEQTSAVESDPWSSPANQGDMFLTETITWNTAAGVDVFGFGEVFSWRDDTDVIPAPGAGLLAGVAGVAAMRRRRG